MSKFHERLLYIVLACGAGGYIGTQVAMWLSGFWGVGALVGGLVGYLTYDPLSFFRAIRRAWDAMKPVGSWFSFRAFAADICIVLYEILFTFMLWGSVGFALIGFLVYTMDGDTTLLWPIAGCTLWLIAFLRRVAVDGGYQSDMDWHGSHPSEKWRMYNPVMFVVNDVIVTIALYVRDLYPITKGFIPRIPSLARWLGAFCARVFVQIHSHVRVMCLVDGAIGGALGSPAGAPILGAAVGIVFGTVNHLIIARRMLAIRFDDEA